jgi:hypothetical protein
MYEILHYSSDDIKVYSKASKIYLSISNDISVIPLPKSFWDIFAFSRLLRRFFRIDKCNVWLVDDAELKLVIIRFGKVYYYDSTLGLIKTLSLKNCRNILHVDLCVCPDNVIAFGEYGANNERGSVPIYSSEDFGKTWKVAFEFPIKSIKHIHNLKYDLYSDKIWCCTGDRDGENKIVLFDRNFSINEVIGDGSQYYRTCDFFFTNTKVVWLMDSPNIKSHVVSYDRNSKKINIGQELAGPVWYSAKVGDGIYIAATSVEPGYSMKHKTAYLIGSKDLVTWKEIRTYKKDCFPINLFKYGVIAFPGGEMKISSVSYFGEALINLDGKIHKINLENEL